MMRSTLWGCEKASEEILSSRVCQLKISKSRSSPSPHAFSVRGRYNFSLSHRVLLSASVRRVGEARRIPGQPYARPRKAAGPCLRAAPQMDIWRRARILRPTAFRVRFVRLAAPESAAHARSTAPGRGGTAGSGANGKAPHGRPPRLRPVRLGRNTSRHRPGRIRGPARALLSARPCASCPPRPGCFALYLGLFIEIGPHHNLAMGTVPRFIQRTVIGGHSRRDWRTRTSPSSDGV